VASRAQIIRLEQRIEGLVARTAKRKFVVIIPERHRGETGEAAMQKHFAKHPEDVGARVFLIGFI